MKNNAWAVWGPPEAWGPWARAHWIRRPCYHIHC